MPKLNDEIVADVLTTAVEGGTNYWAAVSEIERTEDLSVTSVRYHETADGYPGGEPGNLKDDEGREVFGDAWNGYYLSEGVVVTVEDIKRAIRKVAANDGERAWGRTFVNECRALIFDPDEADYDADTADLLVQIALFDEVRYG